MKTNTMVAIFFSLIFLNACTNIPEKISLPDDAILIDFADVKEDPEGYVGFKARWGGVIANIENQPEQTMVEVVHFNLNRSSRPIISDETQGRFRFYYKGMLDPVIYAKGKSITVAGTISNPEKGKIGEQTYLFPVLKAKGVHLWKKTQKIDVRISSDPFRYDPFFYPYYQQPVIVYPRRYRTLKQTTPVRQQSKQER
jgi:outer membrane lipoprotein